MAEIMQPLISEPHEIFAVGPMWEGDGWGLNVRVQTDAQRDRIANDADLLEQMTAIARAESQRPTEFYGYSVQSQEAVDRDYEGSWFYADH